MTGKYFTGSNEVTMPSKYNIETLKQMNDYERFCTCVFDGKQWSSDDGEGVAAGDGSGQADSQFEF